jgi:hypothetical protein
MSRVVVDRGDRADLGYVAGLSADAAAQLDRLPEPARTCALRRAAMSEDRPWTSTNLGRSRAAKLLGNRPGPAECGAR